MKRKPFWALFTAILLLTTLFPSTVLADYSTGPIDCTGSNLTPGEGESGWSWDDITQTLTIYAGTTINVPTGTGYGIKLPHGATLELGDNVTIQAADGVPGTFVGVYFVGGNVETASTITGGSLTVNNGSERAVSVSALLTLDDTTITGTGKGIEFGGTNPTLNVSGNCSVDTTGYAVSGTSGNPIAIEGSGALFLSDKGDATINYGSV